MIRARAHGTPDGRAENAVTRATAAGVVGVAKPVDALGVAIASPFLPDAISLAAR